MAANRPHRPDPSTADRLVAGRIGADDAPPGYRRAAALLGDAGSGFPEPAADTEAATVSAMVAAIQAEPTPQLSPRRSGMLSKILAVKTIAVASFVALSATGAAAAGGHLPDSVQAKVANAAKHVGVNLPHGKGVERVTNLVDPTCVAAEDGTFAKNRGQYLKQERAKGNAEALAAAEKSRCGKPVQSGTPGSDEADDTPEAPENNGKAGENENNGKAGENENNGKAGEDHGAPSDTPAAVETPNPGGIGTGGTASDGANATGEQHANPSAGIGSGNADDHPGGNS